MNRRKEREYILKILYALEYNPISWADEIALFEESYGETATIFAKKMINAYNEKINVLDEEIKAKLINWDFKRVAVIDVILMRMALCEFLCFEDIPPEVTINEIIEISKKYSTPRSGRFINGILDTILKDMKRTNRLKKSGRGLISKVVTSDNKHHKGNFKKKSVKKNNPNGKSDPK